TDWTLSVSCQVPPGDEANPHTDGCAPSRPRGYRCCSTEPHGHWLRVCDTHVASTCEDLYLESGSLPRILEVPTDTRYLLPYPTTPATTRLSGLFFFLCHGMDIRTLSDHDKALRLFPTRLDDVHRTRPGQAQGKPGQLHAEKSKIWRAYGVLYFAVARASSQTFAMQSASRPGLQKPESCPKNSCRWKIPDTVVHGCHWVIGHCYLTVDLEVPSSRLGSCQFSGGQQRAGRLQIEGTSLLRPRYFCLSS
ncbi:uncharacterized protein CLUP02_12453, partial [Colletotrichum lupini]